MDWENTLIEIGVTIFRCAIMIFAFLMAKFIVPYLRRKQLSKSTIGERIKIYLGGIGSCLVISIMWAEYKSILIYFSILSLSTVSGLYFGLKADYNLTDKEREQKNMKEELEDHKKKYGK